MSDGRVAALTDNQTRLSQFKKNCAISHRNLGRIFSGFTFLSQQWITYELNHAGIQMRSRRETQQYNKVSSRGALFILIGFLQDGVLK